MPIIAIVALGSNRRHHRHGAPPRVVEAAIAAIDTPNLRVVGRSRPHATAPVGPSDRRFANAVAIVATTLTPDELLSALKAIERAFGRRRARRWATRVLDLDIIAYGEAVVPARRRWRSARGLVIPHRAMHRRAFVLDPMVEVAPDWRHPVLGLTARQLRARLRR